MTNPPELNAPGLAALAQQVAELRGQVLVLSTRIKKAGITGDLDLTSRFETLAETVRHALDDVSPRGPAAPRWTDIDQGTRDRQLAGLTGWVNDILATQYGGYELSSCWPDHAHVVWELSTLAAEWHRIYLPARPDLSRALDFYDRYLPNTMRRVNEFTRKCAIQCIVNRGK